MKPNFALFLAFDGIMLLHRAGVSDWHLVGEVGLDDKDLPRALGNLRTKAAALDPSGLITKIILPAEQIKYLDLVAEDAPAGDIDVLVANGLEGATPYKLDELAFDWVLSGDHVQVAAVAVETLEEAEAFAVKNGFNPVGFMASPAPGQFTGEPFFGPSAYAAATFVPLPEIERDPTPVRQPASPNTKEELDSVPPPFSSTRAASGEPPVISPQKLGGANRFTPVIEPEINTSAALDESIAESLAPSRAAGPALKSDEASVGSRQRRSKETDRQSDEEARRLTVFGARADQANHRKPRRLGLILTVVLVLLLVAAAALASIFAEDGIAGLFRRPAPEIIAVRPSEPSQSEDPVEQTLKAIPSYGSPDQSSDIPRPAQTPDDTFADAVPEVLQPDGPEASANEPTTVSGMEDLLSSYAATGIWPRAPEVPDLPATNTTETFQAALTDPAVGLRNSTPLPGMTALRPDTHGGSLPAPAPPGTDFKLDDRGLVEATPEGALTADGILVFSGPPPARPTAIPRREIVTISPPSASEEVPEANELPDPLPGIRPRSRPASLVVEEDRSQLVIENRPEIAATRPRVRPASIERAGAIPPAQEQSAPETDTAAVAAALAEATRPPEPAVVPEPPAQVVALSPKPKLRPREPDVAEKPTESHESIEADDEPEITVASARTAPRIPTSVSVARQATEKNAINLRNVNLMGVFGKPNDRRALVRLSNGKLQRVKVGDRLDGGRVSAIGDGELRYNKKGRDVVLRMPKI